MLELYNYQKNVHKNYWIYKNTLTIRYKFNQDLDLLDEDIKFIELVKINKIDCLLFSDDSVYVKEYENLIDFFDMKPLELENNFCRITLRDCCSNIFTQGFNQPINNLSIELKKISFNFIFNQSVENLPIGLTHLKFDYYFNHPVDNLPFGLLHLKLGYNFNQPIDNLPYTIIYLILDKSFNHTVKNIPNSVKKLIYL